MIGPSLSVLMTNYNHGRYLPESLQAIIDQSYPLREFIVIDDASTDDSISVLRGFEQRSKSLKVIGNNRNMGIIHNHNTLLSLSSGEYVFFAGADDRVLPELFQKSMSLLSRHLKAGLCSALSIVIDENSNDIGLHQSGVVSDVECYLSSEDVADLLSRNRQWFMGNTTIYRRQCLVDINGFRPELGSFFDGFASLVIALKHGCCFVPAPLAAWRRMESGYAARCSSDARNWRHIVETATRMMHTLYHDVFPPGYAEAWRIRELYERALTDLASKHRKRSEDLQRDWPRQSRVGKTTYRLAQRVLDRWFVTQSLWLAAKYKQPVYPTVTSGLRKVAGRFR